MSLLLAGGAGVVVGLLTYLLGRRGDRRNRAWRKTALRARGRIVSFLRPHDENIPTVEFEDEHGRTHRVSGQTNAGLGQAIGSAMTVLYERGKPTEARLDSDLVATPGVAMFLGVVFVLAGLVAGLAGWLTGV